MKALLLTEYEQMVLTDVPEPEVGRHDVLVRVEACGICGSDIHGFDGSTGRRIPPLVMGHEASGTVAALGEAVEGFAVGDRVTFDSMVSCGECHFCRRGQGNLCDNRRVLGVSCGEYRRHGALAEFISVPKHIVYKLPDGLPLEHAALVEAVSVAVHAANVTPVLLGDTAVVVGAGMIGLLALQAIRVAGASQVIAIDVNDRRLEVARQLGAAPDAQRQRCRRQRSRRRTDRRPRSRRGSGSRGHRRHSAKRHRFGAKRRQRDLGRQYQPHHRSAAPVGGDPRDYAARHLRLQWRVSRLHRLNGKRSRFKWPR